MTLQRDRYVVMGNPISHSKSPRIHAMFAQQTAQTLQYDAVLVPLGGFLDAITRFQAEGGKGANVTVPFKQDAFACAHELSARAARAQAVNTLVLRDDGTRYGDTTDGVGLMRDLTHNHGIVLRGKRVLVLGAGGAVRGILQPLLDQDPAATFIANRTPDKAQAIAREFVELGSIMGGGFDELASGQFDVVINGTSASLQGDMPSLPEHALAHGAVCYDMMYGRELTPFLRWAHERGACAIDGLGMLVEQAAEAFLLWRGVMPDTGPVIAALRRDLAGS